MRHNRVILNLAGRIDAHLDGTPCQVFAGNMKVQLANEGSLYPEVMVTCGKAEAGDEMVVTDPHLVMTNAGALTLNAIDLVIPFEQLLKGVGREA